MILEPRERTAKNKKIKQFYAAKWGEVDKVLGEKWAIWMSATSNANGFLIYKKTCIQRNL